MNITGYQDSDEGERAMAHMKRHAGQLLEHFDSVQIICTKSKGTNGTSHASWGYGNWYARYGSVAAWIRREDGGLAQESHED